MTVTTLGYTMVICGNADDLQHRYRGRIEKVKFGVPIQEAFAHDIPATLLVLLLKVNKDGPSKKDIWRAPGNQAQVRKLSHIMQHGRLVNIANFSVYTAASVIKKFLSKLPGGIFGLANEQTLFNLFNHGGVETQRRVFCSVVESLSVPSQHLLVLLFGTFYMISESSDIFGTKMTPEAIGISVAPSLFHTCIHDGQRAKMEDVMRFKIASEVISKIIQNFGYSNLFPRDCYEFYARITGRTLRVDENDSRFRFTPPTNTNKGPMPPPSAFTRMAVRCAGSYSMDAVTNVDDDRDDSIVDLIHQRHSISNRATAAGADANAPEQRFFGGSCNEFYEEVLFSATHDVDIIASGGQVGAVGCGRVRGRSFVKLNRQECQNSENEMSFVDCSANLPLPKQRAQARAQSRPQQCVIAYPAYCDRGIDKSKFIANENHFVGCIDCRDCEFDADNFITSNTTTTSGSGLSQQPEYINSRMESTAAHRRTQHPSSGIRYGYDHAYECDDVGSGAACGPHIAFANAAYAVNDTSSIPKALTNSISNHHEKLCRFCDDLELRQSASCDF